MVAGCAYCWWGGNEVSNSHEVINGCWHDLANNVAAVFLISFKSSKLVADVALRAQSAI